MKTLLSILILLMSFQVYSQIPKEEVELAERYSRATNVDTYVSKDTSILWTVQLLYMGGDQYEFRVKNTFLKDKKPRAISYTLNENTQLVVEKKTGWGDGKDVIYTKNITYKGKETQFLSGTIEWDGQKWKFILRIDEKI